MSEYAMYRDIAERTNGDIYIGVVGPVRTGKSTFIKRFMDLLVLPNIENSYSRERAKDELPQSSDGRTIMTTEPKFVPSEAVNVDLDETTRFKARMIDCVGYLVDGANGHMEGDMPRMVRTPWFAEAIPFAEAAEVGTRKVITEHSTLGIVVTTDGSITDIPREDYLHAEERTVSELKAIGKPFVVILNTVRPYTPESEDLRNTLSEKYGVPVMPVNCAQMKLDDIGGIMEKALYEFPVRELKLMFPKWIETLPVTHWLKQSIIKTVKDGARALSKLCHIKDALSRLEDNEHIKKAYIDKILLGEGSAEAAVAVEDSLFYRVLSETTGMDIDGEYQLISTIKVLAEAKTAYDKVKAAIDSVNRKGYGIVTPLLEEMKIDEPKIVKHGSRYGVKIRASAPSIHIARNKRKLEVFN
ncbi:MAG: stage IV sporulation protein A [Defluviitaleaceae bacterium]|nr:stage IV sporulation protein A [Defluviitaleaceae bacterium]MCL2837204.1 stage IV sporulation protein A [Defluviitaleaceae bacterium]